MTDQGTSAGSYREQRGAAWDEFTGQLARYLLTEDELPILTRVVQT